MVVVVASRRNDARLWALLADQFRQAGATDPDRRAQIAVAIVRRERATADVRTWAPGEQIPYDVASAYDVDGYVWVRQSTDPASTMRDSWKMRGFDPDEHESSCGGVQLTPFLLDAWGPLTELRRSGR